MLWLANWWDTVALWLSELAFPFQFAIVIAVLVPICLGLAWAIDRAVDVVSARLARARNAAAESVRGGAASSHGSDSAGS